MIVDVDQLADALAERLGPRVSDTRPLYSPKSLAAKLDISERKVREMLERGDIPSFKVGQAWRIDPDEVERYIERQRGERDAG